MEPDVIGARIIAGMKENQMPISSPCPTIRRSWRNISSEVIGDYRDYPQDPGFDDRIKIEGFRRKGYKAARDAARTATLNV